MVKVSVEAVVTESFGYVRRGWKAAPGALATAVVVAAAAQAFGAAGPGLSVWSFAQIAAATLAAGALYRNILRQAHPGEARLQLGPAGLQWGQVEWWVLAANVTVGVILGVVACVLVFAWALGLSALSASHVLDRTLLVRASSGDPAAFSQMMAGPAGVLTLAVFPPCAALLIYLWARLFLTPILAADVGRLDLGRAWSLTRGATLALVVTLIVILLCEVLAVLSGAMLGALVSGGGATLTGGGLAGLAAGAALATGLSLPMTAGAVAHVYRRESGGGPWAANEFD